MSKGNKSIQLWLARAYIAANKSDQALRVTLNLLKQAKDFSDAYVVRGMALFVNSDFSSFAREDKPVTAANAANQVNQAVNTMKEALKQNPDCKEGMHYLKKCVRPVVNSVLDGKEKFRSREFEGAV